MRLLYTIINSFNKNYTRALSFNISNLLIYLTSVDTNKPFYTLVDKNSLMFVRARHYFNFDFVLFLCCALYSTCDDHIIPSVPLNMA